MRILLNRYHPVCEDIAITLSELGHEVTLSVNTSINDHYGNWNNVKDFISIHYSSFKTISLKEALLLLRKKYFDLVGFDGVFNGDELVIQLCKDLNVPYFCIQGYPLVSDENSNNILSLGWFLPQVQYIQKYPSEGHMKNVDWKNISLNKKSDGKNIHVFYPNFWDIKKIKRTQRSCFGENIISLIQNYSKYNPYSYEIFKNLQKEFILENVEGQNKQKVINEILECKGLLHLKFADQPGIAIFEAMLLNKPVFTMKSFVCASFNQEVLIDGYNSIIADTVDELIYRIKNSDIPKLGFNAEHHSDMLTSFYRQKYKFNKFLENCLENK